MFIRTDDDRLINADCLSVIKCSYTAIEAFTKDHSRTTLASYDSEKVCVLAFEMLAETMEERKELYDLSE